MNPVSWHTRDPPDPMLIGNPVGMFARSLAILVMGILSDSELGSQWPFLWRYLPVFRIFSTPYCTSSKPAVSGSRALLPSHLFKASSTFTYIFNYPQIKKLKQLQTYLPKAATCVLAVLTCHLSFKIEA